MGMRLIIDIESEAGLEAWIELVRERGYSYTVEREGRVIAGGATPVVMGRGGGGADKVFSSTRLGHAGGAGRSSDIPDYPAYAGCSSGQVGVKGPSIPLPQGARVNEDGTFTMPEGKTYRPYFAGPGGSSSPVDAMSNLGGSSEQYRDGERSVDGAACHSPSSVRFNPDDDDI